MNTINRPVSLATPIIFAIFLVIMVVAYGLLTQFYREVVTVFASDNVTYTSYESPGKALANICLLIMDTVFTLLGFGLLLSVFKNQKWAAYLVGMTAFNGRVTFSNIAFSLPVFCILYYLNLYLNALACYSTVDKTNSFVYLDAYGTILVYLFGGIYGIITAALNRSPKETTDHTGIISGTVNTTENFRFNSRAILVLFGLSSGVLGHYVSSILAGKGKVNIEGVIISTFTGGIMVGGLCDVMENIGATLFIAFIAGAISGAFTAFVTPKLNEKSILDSQGMLGPVLVVSLIACIIIHPSILSQFYVRDSFYKPRAVGYAESDFRPARFHLAYFAITAGIAAVTGLIMGLIYKIKRTDARDFQDLKFFVDDYGLYNHEYATPNTAYASAPQVTTSSAVKNSNMDLYGI